MYCRAGMMKIKSGATKSGRWPCRLHSFRWKGGASIQKSKMSLHDDGWTVHAVAMDPDFHCVYTHRWGARQGVQLTRNRGGISAGGHITEPAFVMQGVEDMAEKSAYRPSWRVKALSAKMHGLEKAVCPRIAEDDDGTPGSVKEGVSRSGMECDGASANSIWLRKNVEGDVRNGLKLYTKLIFGTEAACRSPNSFLDLKDLAEECFGGGIIHLKWDNQCAAFDLYTRWWNSTTAWWKVPGNSRARDFGDYYGNAVGLSGGKNRAAWICSGRRRLSGRRSDWDLQQAIREKLDKDEAYYYDL